MKKTVILVRHATAEDHHARSRDFDRELSSKGLSEAQIMAKWLAGEGFSPDIFVSSPAPRAFQTAELFANEFGMDLHDIHSRTELYDGGPRAYLDAVTSVPDSFSTLILFGHNPDITYFAEYLSGGNLGSMKKAGIAIVVFEDQKWEEISAKTGNLIRYKTPKQVIDSE